MPVSVPNAGPSSARQRLGVEDDQRGDRPGQADVEPAQPGDPVGLPGDDARPARPAPRGRTPGPWPGSPAPGRGARRTRSPARPPARRRARAKPIPAARSAAADRVEPRRPARSAPTDPSRASAGAHRVAATGRRPARRAHASSPRGRRTDVGGSRSGAMWGSSRAAYSITSPGTRNPRVSCSTCASGLPRWPSASAHDAGRPRGGRLGEVAEHGQRAGRGAPGRAPAASSARGPAPRRRRCAPSDGVRSTRSAASSSSTASASDQRVEAGLFARLVPRAAAACSSASRMPVGGRRQELRVRRAAATPAGPARPPARAPWRSP